MLHHQRHDAPARRAGLGGHHVGAALQGRLRHLANQLRFGQVVPIAARHFLAHHVELEPRRVEDVAVIGQPERFTGIGRRRIAALGTGADVQRGAIPAQAAFGRQDRPAHAGKAACKETRVDLDNVVVRLKPGHMQRASLVLHLPETHKGAHLVHVARHRMHHVARQLPVRVQLIVAQAGLVRVPPQQPVHEGKAGRVGMQHQAFAIGHKAARHGGRRMQHGQVVQVVQAGRLAFLRRLVGRQGVKQVGHATRAVVSLRLGHHPMHGLRQSASLHQRTRRCAKTRQIGGMGQAHSAQGLRLRLRLRLRRGIHPVIGHAFAPSTPTVQKSTACAGAGARRAARSEDSSRRPGW